MNKLVGRGGAAIVASALLLLSVAAADASTLVNRDDKAHSVEVYIGDDAKTVEIGAGETLELCPEGCFVVMGDQEVDLEGGDAVVEIVDGQFVIDG